MSHFKFYSALDLNYIDKFFSNKLEKIYIPKIIFKDAKSNITNKSDRKFYNCLINGDIDSYSKSTISRKRKHFLDSYNIDINNF